VGALNNNKGSISPTRLRAAFTLEGVKFTNIQRAAIAQEDPESVRNTVQSLVSFYAFGICMHKSCTKNVDEIEPRS